MYKVGKSEPLQAYQEIMLNCVLGVDLLTESSTIIPYPPML